MSEFSRAKLNPYLHSPTLTDTKQAGFLKKTLEQPERLLRFLRFRKYSQETLPHANFRYAVASSISDSLVQSAASSNPKEVDTVFGWLDVLTGPAAKIGSADPRKKDSFLLHEGIVEVRLATVDALVPALSALATNPHLSKDDLMRIHRFLDPLMGHEFFPYYFGSETIPLQEGRYRFGLAEKVIGVYRAMSQHPNADYRVLEDAMGQSASVAAYTGFNHLEKTELLKIAIPGWVDAATHPPAHDVNADRAQMLMSWLGNVYRKEKNGFMIERLTKGDKLDLASDVFEAIRKLVVNEKPLDHYAAVQAMDVLQTVCFYDEFSPKEQKALMFAALPLIKDLLQKYRDIHDLQEAVYKLFNIKIATTSRYVLPIDISRDALVKVGNGVVAQMIGSLEESDPLRKDVIKYSDEIVTILHKARNERGNRFAPFTDKLQQAYHKLNL